MAAVKKVFLAASMVAAATATAAAADLPVRVAPPPYVAPVPIFTWTGPYVGVNAGYSFDDKTKFTSVRGLIPAIDNGIGSTRAPVLSNAGSGFTGGGQIGYNYQFGGFGAGGIVVGVEADAAYVDDSKTGTFTGRSITGLSARNVYNSRLDFLGTVRGRVGFAFDRVLVYGTGGFAFADTADTVQFYTAGNPNQLRYSGAHKGEFDTGYAYGGGIEYALPTGSFLNFLHSSAVTVKAEYLRYELDASNFTARNVLAGGGSGYVIKQKNEGNLARVGLNYKF